MRTPRMPGAVGAVALGLALAALAGGCGKNVVTQPGLGDSDQAGGDQAGGPSGDRDGGDWEGGDRDGLGGDDELPAVLTVTGVNPPDGAMGVSTISGVSVTFSHPLNTQSVTGQAGLNAGGSAFPVSVSVSTNRITFTHAQPFAHETLYTVWVGAQVRSSSGLELGERFESSFTTGAAHTVTPAGAYGLRLSPVGGSATHGGYTLHIISESTAGDLGQATLGDFTLHNAAAYIKHP